MPNAKQLVAVVLAGLALAQRLSALMGGGIRRGASGALELALPMSRIDPIVIEEAAPPRTSPIPLSIRLPPTRSPILLVEPNPSDQVEALELLEGLGFEVEAVTDPARAVERVARDKYAAVLLSTEVGQPEGREGVSAANVNLMTGAATVTYDPAATGPEDLVDAIRATGYGAELPRPGESAESLVALQDAARGAEIAELKWKLAVSLAAGVLAAVVSAPLMAATGHARDPLDAIMAPVTAVARQLEEAFEAEADQLGDHVLVERPLEARHQEPGEQRGAGEAEKHHRDRHHGAAAAHLSALRPARPAPSPRGRCVRPRPR